MLERSCSIYLDQGNSSTDRVMSAHNNFGTTEAPADVCLKVFDTYFLVHSVFLKQFSAYFRSFLDSPDKQDSSNGSAEYKYDWTTKIDEDKGVTDWFLVAINSRAGELNVENFHGDATFEVDCFRQLLLSMYNTRWEFRRWDKRNAKQNLQKLKRIAQLADYYDCIPVVANAMTRLMVEEQPVKHFPPTDHGKFKRCIAALLEIGWKLHHKELVKDCIIIAAGEQAADGTRGYSDYYLGMDLSEFDNDKEVEKIKKIIETVRGRVNEAIVNAHNELVGESRYGERNDLIRESMCDVAQNPCDHTGLPSYYRSLYNRLCGHGLRQEGAIRGLLRNNLTFKIEALSGDWHDFFHCFFLCGKVEDADLPWKDEK